MKVVLPTDEEEAVLKNLLRRIHDENPAVGAADFDELILHALVFVKSDLAVEDMLSRDNDDRN
jgi:hypothetical protein